MAADALSDVMKTVRMTGAVFFDVAARGQWASEAPPREAILPLILPGAEALIAYHLVTEGRCFVSLIDGQPFEVKAGDIVVFTRCDPHVVSSAPGMRAPLPAGDPPHIFAQSMQLPYVVKCGDADGPPNARLVCGFLACDSGPFNPLLENLPTIILANSSRDGATWLGELISLALREAANKGAGGEGILARFSELMFIEVVRQYLNGLPPEQVGWLAGLRDPFVSKALSLFHHCPSRDWTLAELARQVGTSRSEIAERFAGLVGVPPMQYLAKWRMQIAAGLLNNNENIAAVAGKVGYGSEASFSRAFKKIVGMSPSYWRDHRLRVQPSVVPRGAS